MSMIRPITIAATTAALVLCLSVFALLIGLSLAGAKNATAAEVELSTGLGQSVIPTAGGKVYLRINLKALTHGTSLEEDRAPVNVALVMDRSGSMRGERIKAAKEAARIALGRLGRGDTASLVAYNHNVDILRRAGPVTNHQDMLRAIERLSAGGRYGAFCRS